MVAHNYCSALEYLMLIFCFAVVITSIYIVYFSFVWKVLRLIWLNALSTVFADQRSTLHPGNCLYWSSDGNLNPPPAMIQNPRFHPLVELYHWTEGGTLKFTVSSPTLRSTVAYQNHQMSYCTQSCCEIIDVLISTRAECTMDKLWFPEQAPRARV